MSTAMGDKSRVQRAKKHSKRVNGTHIKHNGAQKIPSVVERETTFLVKSSTPYMSAVKRIVKIIKKFDKSVLPLKRYQNGQYKKVNYITVKGMGKSIEKTLAVGLRFQNKLGYKVDILTGSVEVLDEFQDVKPDKETNQDVDEDKQIANESDDDDGESVFKKRMVSSIEVRIWLKRE